jgi:hypothetical protein
VCAVSLFRVTSVIQCVFAGFQAQSPPRCLVKGQPAGAYDEDLDQFQAELEAAIIDHPPARPAEASGIMDYVCSRL